MHAYMGFAEQGSSHKHGVPMLCYTLAVPLPIQNALLVSISIEEK